ncbi:peptidoglycan editing factor PgeF [Thiospirochaeta perfilievii]|nr:peptidoglycan editing factor PgeF [Thiospirochaeta perfilievii]
MKSENIDILEWNIFRDIEVKTGITTRRGGFSNPPFDSLNLAKHTGDNIEYVDKNREILCNKIGSEKSSYTSGIQVHGDNIHLVDSSNKGLNNFECDALITRDKNILLNIFVADCVPIVVYDKAKSIGAVCHCGWKGSKKKLLKKVIYFLIDNYNSYRSDILIGIGPSIGPCCYNVSKDLFESFKTKKMEGFVKKNSYYLDLKLINKNQALSVGIPDDNIEIMDYCTSCNNNLFYSFRKEGESSGRFSCFLEITS